MIYLWLVPPHELAFIGDVLDDAQILILDYPFMRVYELLNLIFHLLQYL